MIIHESLLYLDTALDDCNAAKTLYKSKLYPQSIYSLHQAVEKTCKYYAIRNGLVNPHEVKNKIGHNSFKLFTTLLRNHFQSLEDYWEKNNDDISFNFNSFFNQIKNCFKIFEKLKSKNLINPNKHELHQLIFQLHLLDKDEKLPTPIDYIFNDPENLINGLSDLGIIHQSDIQNLEREKQEKLKSELTKILKLVPKYQKNILKLILISTFFNNNLNETRYPDLDSMKIPSEIFNKDHPLIRFIPEITNHITSIIEIFKVFNEFKI